MNLFSLTPKKKYKHRLSVAQDTKNKKKKRKHTIRSQALS